MAEDQNVFSGQTKIVVFLKEINRFLMGCWARLNTERQASVVFFAHRMDTFDVDLEQGRLREGANRVNPLGVRKVKTRALSARDYYDRDFVSAKKFFASLNGLQRGDFIRRFV